MQEERVLRLFGVSEETVRRRLSDVLADDCVAVTLLYCDEECVLRLSASDATALMNTVAVVTERLGAYVYSTVDETLEQTAVAFLKEKGLTVALAESCTGGLTASRLTSVAGCSQVFGTGVVSYSWDCKQKLLGVSLTTLQQYGAVSAQTACEMAEGIRRQAGASVGVAITGEAGPQTAEQQPVGTVFVALADKKRVWAYELHLAGDRETIRRTAASYALDKLRRYAQAYPTVMAGGQRHAVVEPRRRLALTLDGKSHRGITALLPQRGTRRLRIIKILAAVAVVLVLLSTVWMMYNHFLAPASNREFQDDLANLYWENRQPPTEEDTLSKQYPLGMHTQFRGLYDINNDIAGWIHIADTAINYPVTLDADGYYVNHNFSDQYSVYGQPYFVSVDKRDTLQSARLLAIKGNNTRDEQMFSSLLSYRRIAYLREHAVIEMNTLYAIAQWRVFAVAVVDEWDDGFEYMPSSFANDETYMAYLQQLKKRSLFTSDCVLTADSQTLLLVTDAEREYGFSGAKMVIAACRQTEETSSPVTYGHNGRVVWPAKYVRKTTAGLTTTAATVLTTTTATDAVVPTTTTTEHTVADTTAVTATTTTTSTTVLVPSTSVTTSETTQETTVETTTTTITTRLHEETTTQTELPTSLPEESTADTDALSTETETQTVPTESRPPVEDNKEDGDP